MCNTCNTNARCCGGNGYIYNGNGWSNVLTTNGGYGYTHTTNGGVRIQQIFRDCNGCLWVRVCSTCSCHQNTCGCCNNNGSISGNTGNGVNGGGYGCVTLCGALSNTLNNTATSSTIGSGDAYYARQYGLYGSNRSCCGSSY